MSLPITTAIGFLGALQGLVLAGAIASLGGTARQPNQALALILVVFSVSVAAIVAEHAGFLKPSIWLILLEYTLLFFFPPAFWYYADTVLTVKSRFSVGVHLIPAGLWLGYLVAIGFGWITWRWLPPILGLIVYLTTYTIAIAIRAWRGTYKPKTLISHGFVLRVIIALLFVLHGAQFIRYFFRDVYVLTDIVPVTATIIIYLLSILAFRQSKLFAGHAPPSLRQKYDASTLTPERAEEIQQRLMLVMDREKPFLNENLNLSQLASKLAIPRAHLSQVVNTNLECSFPEFLNEYRVREATQLLNDPTKTHLTIEAIGYEAGFRSRSGFHSAFKRITGETPAQARARLS